MFYFTYSYIQIRRTTGTSTFPYGVFLLFGEQWLAYIWDLIRKNKK